MVCVKKNVYVANNIDGKGSLSYKALGDCQAKPYTKPLAYRFHHITTDHAQRSGIYSSYGNMANADFLKGKILVGPGSFSDAPYAGLVIQATNKCLDKFYNELDEQAMLAVNFAERQQSASMMTARLFQLARFGKALRKFDLLTAAHTLGLDPKSGTSSFYWRSRRRKGWSDAKARSKIVADAWLEFHFGWEPLVKDIFHAIQVLQSPMTGKTVQANAGVAFNESDFQKPAKESYLREAEGVVLHKCGATLLVTDTNAYAANRLGLTNPAAWVWELIPFSFIVDWFTTVGSFINQWSDLEGMKLVDPWNASTLVVKKCKYAKSYSGSYLEVRSHGVLFSRDLGMSRYKIAFRPMKRLSLARAATAIALLIQFLPR